MAAGSPHSIRQVAERGFNLLLDQFASIETIGERISLFREELARVGRPFDPSQVAVARALNVSRTQEEKHAALERRQKAQQRLTAISQRPDGQNKASILNFADTREANEESALYGLPDEIADKLERLRAVGATYLLLTTGGSRETLRRFGQDLMPAFVDKSAVPAAG